MYSIGNHRAEGEIQGLNGQKKGRNSLPGGWEQRFFTQKRKKIEIFFAGYQKKRTFALAIKK